MVYKTAGSLGREHNSAIGQHNIIDTHQVTVLQQHPRPIGGSGLDGPRGHNILALSHRDALDLFAAPSRQGLDGVSGISTGRQQIDHWSPEVHFTVDGLDLRADRQKQDKRDKERILMITTVSDSNICIYSIYHPHCVYDMMYIL